MRSSFIIVSLAAGLTAATANAGQWNMTYDGQGAHLKTVVSYNASAASNAGPATTFNTIKAGEHLFHVGGLNYSTFCVQLFEGLTEGETICFTETDVASVPDSPPSPGPMGALKATLIHDLYWRYHSFTTDGSVDSDTSNIRHAAFQIAIYELSHENFAASTAAGALAELDLGLGAFQAQQKVTEFGSAAAIQLAADMLAALGGDGFHFFGAGLKGLTDPTRQDQLIIVPVPAAVGLACAGLGLMGFARRRMKKA
jgi:hypothetical protein